MFGTNTAIVGMISPRLRTLLSTLAPNRSLRPVLLLALGGFALCGAIAIGTALVLFDLYHHALADKGRELQNFASAIAGHVDRDFRAISLVEKGLIDEISASGIADAQSFEEKLSSRDVYVRLKDKLDGLPHAAAFP